MKIGIFGGSFNPPHRMHRKIALYLIQTGYLDSVIFVPTGDRYQKKNLVDSHHRYSMVKLMIEGYPELRVSDYELKNTLTYTYQTLDHFKESYPHDEIYFICGSDNLKEFTTWRNYPYILENYPILVIQREGDDIESIMKNLGGGNIILIDTIHDDISSTKIRNSFKQERKSQTVQALDEKVEKYIVSNGLYQK